MRVFIPFILLCVLFLTSCGGNLPSGTYNKTTAKSGPKGLATPNDYAQSTGQGPYAEGGLAHQDESKLNAPPVKVAILLPLSGSKADIGQSLLQAAQLALFDLGAETFELMPADTQGNPALAAQAAQQVIKDGAQLILGPLFLDSVRSVKPIAARANINVIAFSTDWSQAGGNVYLTGFMPFVQVDRITDYAARQGYIRTALISENNTYGNAVERTFISAAGKRGVQVPKIIHVGQARTITPFDLQSLKSANIDSVLIAVNGQDAANISKAMSDYGMPSSMIKRLGTGLWDDEMLARNPYLDGAWFSAPAPSQRRRFEENYADLYGIAPPRLATLSYDATALAAVLAKMGTTTKSGAYRPAYNATSLHNPNGFAGIDGVFRFNRNGLIERQLSVIEFRNKQMQEIDQAEKRF